MLSDIYQYKFLFQSEYDLCFFYTTVLSGRQSEPVEDTRASVGSQGDRSRRRKPLPVLLSRQESVQHTNINWALEDTL